MARGELNSGREADAPRTALPDDLVPAGWARALYAAVFLIVLALLFIDVTGVSDWAIDDTTIALIVILAFLPLLGRIKSASFGAQGASFELFEQLQKEVTEVGYQTKRNAVGVARAAELEGILLGSDEDVAEPALADSSGARQGLDTQDGPRSEDQTRTDGAPVVPIERIVWVDDNPEGNAPYREELERRWEVVTATSTRAAKALISADPARTLVITDAVREEGRQTNYEAGLELVAWLREEYPDVPVLVFAGASTVRDHGDAFRASGVSAVTGDFGALFGAIGAIDGRRFMATVVAKLRRAGLALDDEQPPGVELLARRSDGRRIAVEVKTWQRTPPLQLVEAAIDQLAEAQRNVGAEEALLIVRKRLQQAGLGTGTAIPPDLHIVPVDELERWLGD